MKQDFFKIYRFTSCWNMTSLYWCSIHLGIILIVAIGFLVSCEGPVPTDLDRAAKVVKYMSREDVLRATSFAKHFPKGKPSDFVNWFLSDEGRAQWPDSLENADSNPEVRKEAYEKGAPIVPRKMNFVANRPDKNKGRQLVVIGDDSQGILVVEGYGNPVEKPKLLRQWKLPN